jgi:hypothetical protein
MTSKINLSDFALEIDLDLRQGLIGKIWANCVVR